MSISTLCRAEARMPGLHCTSAPLADEPECALCGVLHLPSEPVDFAPQAVSLAKISTPPRRVTCLSESSQVRWGLGVILIDGHAEDPETAAKEFDLASSAPVMEDGQRPGRVQVVVERGPEVVPTK